MKNDILYGLIPGFRIEGATKEMIFKYGLTVCKNPGDIVQNLMQDYKDEYTSKKMRKNIDNCQFAIKKKVDADDGFSKDNAVNDIQNFVSLMRIVKPIRVLPKYFIVYYSKSGDYLMHIKPSYTQYYASGHDIELRKFPKRLLSQVDELWKNVPTIIENNNRVRKAWILYEKAYGEYYPMYRVIWFAIALECLFQTSDSELAFSLALRTTEFIANGRRERENIFNATKKAYTTRSKLVHGLNYRRSGTRISDAEITLRENVRRALLKIIRDPGLIDIFDSKRHRDYLQGIVLHKS